MKFGGREIIRAELAFEGVGFTCHLVLVDGRKLETRAVMADCGLDVAYRLSLADTEATDTSRARAAVWQLFRLERGAV